jgi:TonB family protein
VGISLALSQHGENVSGALAYESAARKLPFGIRMQKMELHGDQLTFEMHNDEGQNTLFRLMLGSEGLSGEAISGSQISKVTFPRSQFHPLDSERPMLLYKVDPEFSEEARIANWHGTVVVSVTIDEDGNPTNVKVLREVGLGIDEKAVECLKKWLFFPAMKYGTPVKFTAYLELNFQPPSVQK